MNYFSQYGQDKFLNETVFNNKKNGVFLDIGAYDGIIGSNTYFFEKELKWTGICIEPLKGAFEKLKQNRQCTVINAAAWKENSKQILREIHGYSEMLSGLVGCYDERHKNRITSEVSSLNQTYSDIIVECIDINELLFDNKLCRIDFLSIDVEGAEFQILEHLNLDLFKTDYILCENNYDDARIRELLRNKGYRLINKLGVDDLYIRDYSLRKHKFKIVIPSYNNEQWVEVNYDSINTQTYDNYEVLYINDASIDNTLVEINSKIKDNPKWTVVTNSKNRRRGYNTSPYNEDIKRFMTTDSDILTFIDGDDWLAYNTSLEQLNEFYIQYDPWMTYGRFICYTTFEVGFPQNTPYPQEVHNNNSYRRDWWRASHLRTFKWWLYKRIKMEDLIYSKTGDYYFHAEDLAGSFPCLEMCPQDKIGIINNINYVFNDFPTNRIRGVQREKEAGVALELEIRNKPVYNKIIL